ncbi:MAG: hypothetical protein IT424_10040, partial [Pirellulales bacterium]|nr:hypothetical protein [Pirellulales bacterium]
MKRQTTITHHNRFQSTLSGDWELPILVAWAFVVTFAFAPRRPRTVALSGRAEIARTFEPLAAIRSFLALAALFSFAPISIASLALVILPVAALRALPRFVSGRLATSHWRRTGRAERRPFEPQRSQFSEHRVQLALQPIEALVQRVAPSHITRRNHHRASWRAKAARARLELPAAKSAEITAKTRLARPAILWPAILWPAILRPTAFPFPILFTILAAVAAILWPPLPFTRRR